MKLTEIVKKEILKEYDKGSPEAVSEKLVDMFDFLRHILKSIKFDKVRKWARANPKEALKYKKMLQFQIDLIGKKLK